MTIEATQAWIAAATAGLTAVLGIFKYFNYRSKRDRIAAVGATFAATVESLASDNETRRMAAAVLLRRFFNRRTEQGTAGTPYSAEAVEVIAGLLREEPPGRLQKVLADGLRYAVDLRRADLQRCHLQNAYLGIREGDKRPVDLSCADLFEADCSDASFKGVNAVETVFYREILVKTVFQDANLERADFRAVCLTEAKFAGARIGGARFDQADGVPTVVARLLNENSVARAGAQVPTRTWSREIAVEFAHHGITVNTVSPGVIETPINAEVLGSDAVRSTMLDAIPLQRLGRPVDVAAAIAFLASSDADFISGADIVVDGAMIASAAWGTARTAWQRHDSTSRSAT